MCGKTRFATKLLKLNQTPPQKDYKLQLVNSVVCFTGRKETTSELLKSIIAIYLYRFEVERLLKLDVDPANFKDFLYQPEKDVQTGEFVHQREDHNHLLKRIIASLREGNILDIDLRFMHYEALTGKNKQSVPDCERIISVGVISFMERNNHESEKKSFNNFTQLASGSRWARSQ